VLDGGRLFVLELGDGEPAAVDVQPVARPAIATTRNIKTVTRFT
jgi:hypothetical protein